MLKSLTAREGVEAARQDELGRSSPRAGVRTVFHPIVRLLGPGARRTRGVDAAHAAACSFDSVEELFAFAESTDLLVEFERLCRDRSRSDRRRPSVPAFSS